MVVAMARKQRSPKEIVQESPALVSLERLPTGACAVCGLRDARALTEATLAGGSAVVLCGTHELMHRRGGSAARSVDELRTLLADRRRENRRGVGFEEVDELAASLSAAFTRERRTTERRAQPV